MATDIEKEVKGLSEDQIRTVALGIDPVNFARQFGFNPVDWQADFLHNKHPRIIMNCPRGAGKSLLTAILTLHHALYTPNALVLLFSPGDRQSMELFKKVTDFYKLLGKDASVEYSKAESAHRLELKNGSRIISLPNSPRTVVGYHNVTLLVIDEAALIDNEELYTRARPMLDHKNGRLFLLSTPFGKSGFFYREWSDWEKNDKTVWRGITVTTNECPWMLPSFLAEERQKLGDRGYRQEYECSFEENIDSYFSLEEIENAYSKDVRPLFTADGELDIPLPSVQNKRGMEGLGWSI
jgi:hypothetical protein